MDEVVEDGFFPERERVARNERVVDRPVSAERAKDNAGSADEGGKSMERGARHGGPPFAHGAGLRNTCLA